MAGRTSRHERRRVLDADISEVERRVGRGRLLDSKVAAPRCDELFTMTEQKKLFETESQLPEHCCSKIARDADPQTSHQGVEYIQPELGALQSEFVRRLSELGEATAQEVAAGRESIRKRAKECERLGVVISTGTRRCRVTGQNATTYRVRT